MARVKRMRLRENEHFNPNYLIPDRILNSTDYFSAIQPKKVKRFLSRLIKLKVHGNRVCNWCVQNYLTLKKICFLSALYSYNN